MESLPDLKQQLAQLEAQIQDLKAAGSIPYPASFVLDSTVSKERVYYRRRVRESDGKPGASQ